MSEELKIIAEQLGVTVEYMWPILVDAQRIQALYAVIVNVVFSIVLCTGYHAGRKFLAAREIAQKANGGYLDDDTYVEVLIVVIFVLSLIAGLFLLVHMFVQIGQACTPEYEALRQLRRWIPGS